MPSKNSWYIKSGQQISGPFPSKLVSQRVLLGRLQLSDEASQDKENWSVIRNIPELVPDLLKMDQSDSFVQERIAAARRWSDERGSFDRRHRQSAESNNQYADQRSGRERRQLEDLEEINYREERDVRQESDTYQVRQVNRQPKSYTLHSLVLLFIVVASIYAAYVYWPRAQLEGPNSCDALPAQKVNWSNCSLQCVAVKDVQMQGATLKNANLTGARFTNVNLSGADMSYAIFSLANMRGSDLSNSHMIGVNFRNADLSHVDLSSSNLAYANFSGARLVGTNFSNAILEKAIWFDGRMCAVGSVGSCD